MTTRNRVSTAATTPTQSSVQPTVRPIAQTTLRPAVQATVRPTMQQLGQAVKRLQVKHHRAGNEALKPLGISIVQWDALRHLRQHPGASLHELALLTFQTDQAFGTLAARMEARGLIRRVSGAGRAIRPELTQEGERVLAAGTAAMEEVLQASFGRLSSEERATFGGLLSRLVDDAPGAGV